MALKRFNITKPHVNVVRRYALDQSRRTNLYCRHQAVGTLILSRTQAKKEGIKRRSLTTRGVTVRDCRLTT